MVLSIISLRKVLIVGSIILLNSCYYDVEEELYGPLDCNPVDVSLSTDIAPIMNNYCNSCHNQGNQSGGVITDNYAELKIVAENGRLIGSIKHNPGFSAMPQGVEKLSSCNISKIEVWIAEGVIDN